MNCLRSLGRCDRGFESHSRHGCLCVHLFCVCVQVAALRGTYHSSKESYCLWKMITELNKRPGPWKGWKNHWEEKYRSWGKTIVFIVLKCTNYYEVGSVLISLVQCFLLKSSVFFFCVYSTNRTTFVAVYKRWQFISWSSQHCSHPEL
jgi:hypothetical protein